jgi:hypothetical protein
MAKAPQSREGEARQMEGLDLERVIERALHLAARSQDGVRKNPYQTHTAAAAHQANVSSHNSAAISSAAAPYSARLPRLEPQKTQIRFRQ